MFETVNIRHISTVPSLFHILFQDNFLLATSIYHSVTVTATIY